MGVRKKDDASVPGGSDGGRTESGRAAFWRRRQRLILPVDISTRSSRRRDAELPFERGLCLIRSGRRIRPGRKDRQNRNVLIVEIPIDLGALCSPMVGQMGMDDETVMRDD